MLYLLADWLRQPLTLALLAWIASLALAWSARRVRRRRAHGTRVAGSGRAALAGGLGLVGTVFLWVLATPAASNALVRSIEVAGTGVCRDDPALPIVIPGADMDAWADTQDPWRILGRDTLARSLLGARLPGSAPMFVQGGGDNQRALGQLMKLVLVDLGVDSARIVAENSSRSTADNARALRELLPPGAAIRLVTSPLHMERASRAYHASGYTICPVSTASLASPSTGLASGLPWIASLQRSHVAVREHLARWLYLWRSRQHEAD